MFLDDADAEDAEGYHDLTKNGLPLSKVFVKTTLSAGDKVSVTACHELAEMLVDPAINLWADGPSGTNYAYEMCDAVEEEEFPIDGIAMSDFVYPAYFEAFRKPNSVQFDYRKCESLFKFSRAAIRWFGRAAQSSRCLAQKRKRKSFSPRRIAQNIAPNIA